MTSIPAQPLKTTQNGVVFFHLLFAQLGVGPEGRLLCIAILNYVLHLSAVYPLYKIAYRVGLPRGGPMAALLAVHLGAWHIYRLQLLPINDGVFNALSIWLTYLLIVGLQGPARTDTPQTIRRSGNSVKFAALALAVSVVLVHFRLNTVMILGACFIAAICTRRYRYGLWSVVCLVASLASTLLLYSFVDASRISTQHERFWVDIVSRLQGNVIEVGNQILPNLMLSKGGFPANVICGSFLLAVLLAVFSGLKRREPAIVFTALSCSAAITFVVCFYFQSHRFLVHVFPFLYLLILIPGAMRPIGYMLVAVVLVSSFSTYSHGFHRSPCSSFWLHIHNRKIALAGRAPLLLSERPRHSYFFLGCRSFRKELIWDDFLARDSVFILGTGRFVSDEVAKIRRMRDAMDSQAMLKIRSLTAGYKDELGHELIQLYDFGPKNRKRHREARQR